METNATKSIIKSGSKAVLLCFLPPAASGESVQERTRLLALSQRLQQRLPGLIRVLNVDESLHPDVVRSFNLQQLPALVLVQQGIERWRQEGVQTWEELTLIPYLLEQVNGL